jgi:hypothetical protein
MGKQRNPEKAFQTHTLIESLFLHSPSLSLYCCLLLEERSHKQSKSNPQVIHIYSLKATLRPSK